MNDLLEECIRIRNLKWIKSVNNDNSGIGLTFEKQLGKLVENFEIPDYNGIEIKAHRYYGVAKIVLFSAVPDSILFAIKKIHEKYAYPDKDFSQFKVFNVAVDAKGFTPMSRKYYFRLSVDYDKKYIVFNVYNRKYELIDNEIAWSFDMLQEKLERKLSKLLVVRCRDKVINGDKFFYYTNYDYYVLNSFNSFLKAIESGKICVNFRISVYKKGKYFGKIHNRGTTFDINIKDLDAIFNHVLTI